MGSLSPNATHKAVLNVLYQGDVVRLIKVKVCNHLNNLSVVYSQWLIPFNKSKKANTSFRFNLLRILLDTTAPLHAASELNYFARISIRRIFPALTFATEILFSSHKDISVCGLPNCANKQNYRSISTERPTLQEQQQRKGKLQVVSYVWRFDI